jgi:phosphoribosylformylglycinamidine synthase subunit PurQ / glutaminase
VVPGGFSYGDYLRCGAIAARSPIMQDIRAKSLQGLQVLGVCNGFQIITEAGLLPGALVRNADLRFVCRQVKLKVENNQTFFTNRMQKGAIVSCPVAHGEGNYICRCGDAEAARRREPGGLPLCRGHQPQRGAQRHRRDHERDGHVIGMMPHPENMIEPLHGRTDCRPLFESLLAA